VKEIEPHVYSRNPRIYNTRLTISRFARNAELVDPRGGSFVSILKLGKSLKHMSSGTRETNKGSFETRFVIRVCRVAIAIALPMGTLRSESRVRFRENTTDKRSYHVKTLVIRFQNRLFPSGPLRRMIDGSVRRTKCSLNFKREVMKTDFDIRETYWSPAGFWKLAANAAGRNSGVFAPSVAVRSLQANSGSQLRSSSYPRRCARANTVNDETARGRLLVLK